MFLSIRQSRDNHHISDTLTYLTTSRVRYTNTVTQVSLLLLPLLEDSTCFCHCSSPRVLKSPSTKCSIAMSDSVRNCRPQLKESPAQKPVRLLPSQKCLAAPDNFSRDKTVAYSGHENTSYFHVVYVVYSEASGTRKPRTLELSNYRTVELSNYQTVKPSNRRTVEHHRTVELSNYQMLEPSNTLEHLEPLN